MTVNLRGLGSGSLPASIAGTVPITCPAGFQVQPIKAWVNSPDEPAYMAASNWKCTSQADMNVQSGMTYGSGLKMWASGDLTAILMGTLQAPLYFPTAPAYALGLLTPPLIVLALLLFGGKGK
jgi:hypothetical protein